MFTCPNCGKEMDEICECGYNINRILNCPYKISGKCVHNEKDCYIEGLNYELCEIYLHKAGIN